MGWAKYAEDNYEIMLERQMLMQRNRQLEETKAPLMPKMILPLQLPIEEQCEDKDFYYYQKNKKTDKTLICRCCGKKFVFSAKSQSFFEKQDWESPKRCKKCKMLQEISFLMRASY